MSDKQPIKFKDFDEALEELDIPDIVFMAKGVSYSLPGQISAKVVLKQMAFLTGADLDAQGIPEWLELLIGKENLNDMLDNGVSWQQVNDIAQWLLEQYGIAPDKELAEVLDKAVNEGGEEEDPK
tara:strand:+ start:215 stop:589 length:375 start_codon:yes stop_codon:yes gene_type:complete